MKKVTLTIVSVMLGALIASGAQATVPELIPVQGVLTDGDGEFIDGATNMVFRLYDSETASTAIYTETLTGGDAPDVDEGFFTVYLGAVTAIDPATLAAASELWLGVTVGTDSEMNRTQLGAVPFALEAQNCQQIGSLTESDIFSSETDLTTLLDDNYAPTAHNHDSAYAPISHNHDSAYAAISHNHDSSYAAVSHNHDSTYVNEGQANSVTPAMMTAEAGLEYVNNAASINPTTSDQTVASVNVAWPGAGYLFMVADYGINCTSETYAVINFEVVSTSTTTNSWIRGITRSSEYITSSVSWVYPVTAAGSSQINLLGRVQTDTCSYLRANNFTVVYVPTHY